MRRLLTRAEFLAVAAKGRKWGTPLMLVQVLPQDQAEPRLGLTASRRVGGAVVRNRAKRRLREAMRATLHNHRLKSCDIVLIAKPATATCPFAELRRDLETALGRLGALA